MNLFTRQSPIAVCLAAALLFFYSFFQLTMFNSISTPLMRSFAISPSTLGYLSASYFFANALATLPAGILMDRFSVRHIALSVMALCAIATLIFSFTHCLALAIVCRMLNGIGNTIGFLASMQIATRWLPSKRLALGIGLIITFIMLGGIVSQTPFSFLVTHSNWRVANGISGLVGILFFLYMWFYLQEFPAGHTKPQQAERSILKNLILVITNKQNWLCGLYTALMNLPIYLLGALWGVLYLENAFAFSTTQATTITGMLFIGMIAGSTGMSGLSDLLRNRKLVMTLSATFSAALVLFMIWGLFTHILILMLIFFLLGFLSSAQVISYPIVAESNPLEVNSTAMAIVGITVNLMSFIAQPLFGYLIELGHKIDGTTNNLSIGNYNHAMGLLLIAFGVSVLLAKGIKGYAK